MAKRSAWVSCGAVEVYGKMDKNTSLQEHLRIKPEGNERMSIKGFGQRGWRMEDGGKKA